MPQSQLSTISDSDIEEIGAQDIEGPEIEPVPTVEQLRHAKNVGAEVQAGIPGELLKRTSSLIAAVPRVAGSVGGAVPLIGGPLAALGETAAQGIEMAGGAREGSPLDPSAYNKTEIGTQAAIGAIPGGFMARTFKPATKMGARLAGAAEGAAVGSLATGASTAAQGRAPTAGELGTSMAVGGALGGTLGGYKGARQALPMAGEGEAAFGLGGPRSDYTEKAHKQLYAAIRPQASDTREFSEHLNAALPYIYANRRGHVNGITDMEQAARGTMKRLWNLHIEPVVAMNSHKVVDTQPIADSLMSQITRNTKKSVARAITEEAQKFQGERTLGELNDLMKKANARTKSLQEAPGKKASTLRVDEKTAWQFNHVNSLRSALADQAGEITGQPEMYMKLRKDWGALREVANEAGDAAKRWEHQQKIESAGMFPKAQRMIKAAAGGIGWGGSAAARRAGSELITEYMANPDNQVKGAFKRLRFGQRMSSQFPEPNLGPERKLLPGPGETGEPSIGDLRYRMPENRAAGKAARQRQEGSRLLTGQTRQDFANQPAPGEPPPIAPGEMELSPGQIPRDLRGARTGPITIGQPPDLRIQPSTTPVGQSAYPAGPPMGGRDMRQAGNMPFERGLHRVTNIPTQKALGPARSIQLGSGGGPMQGETVPITIAPVPRPTVKGQQLQPYAGEERRLSSSVEANQGRRGAELAAANPEVAQQAAQLKDAYDNATPSQIRAGLQVKWHRDLSDLAEQNPWIADYLVNRNVTKGGARR